MGANKSPNSSYAKVIKAIKVHSFRTQRETPTSKVHEVAPSRETPIAMAPELAPHRESPATKAPEKTIPTSPSRSKEATPKTIRNEAKERQSSKGASGRANAVPEK